MASEEQVAAGETVTLSVPSMSVEDSTVEQAAVSRDEHAQAHQTSEDGNADDIERDRQDDDRAAAAAADDWHDPFEELTLEAIEDMLAEELTKKDNLEHELAIYKHFVERQAEPSSPSREPSAKSTLKKGTSRTNLKKPRGREKSANQLSLAPASGKLLKLKPAHKTLVAEQEIDHLRTELDRQKASWLTTRHQLEAAIEERKMRLQEVAKLHMQFENDMKAIASEGKGKVYKEDIEKYYERRFKDAEVQLDKLRLKHVMASSEKARLDNQLKYKSDQGSNLQQVDFDQLRIKNTDQSASLSKQSTDLVKLKAHAGKLDQSLIDLKTELDKMNRSNESLRGEIRQRKKLLASIERELTSVEQQCDADQKSNQRLRDKLESFRAPDVLEYVSDQASVPTLKSTVRTLERKVNVAEMELRQTKQTFRAVRATQQGQGVGRR